MFQDLPREVADLILARTRVSHPALVCRNWYGAWIRFGRPQTSSDGVVLSVALAEFYCSLETSYTRRHLCRWAAEHGALEVLQWARTQKCPWNSLTCFYIAKRGLLEVLQWARKEGCPWDSWVCTVAASEGHLNVLRWAHENGCPFTSEACFWAAENGQLDALQWLHEHGCPWNKQVSWTWKPAIRQWALENGCSP
jgi:hypothetical protein